MPPKSRKDTVKTKYRKDTVPSKRYKVPSINDHPFNSAPSFLDQQSASFAFRSAKRNLSVVSSSGIFFFAFGSQKRLKSSFSSPFYLNCKLCCAETIFQRTCHIPISFEVMRLECRKINIIERKSTVNIQLLF